MKPKFDLNSPIIKHALELYNTEVKKAILIHEKVENAVLPIYSIPKSKAHNKLKTKPEQIGSGVLVQIKDHYFIFSATHVYLEITQNTVLTAPTGIEKIEELTGYSFNSKSPKETKYSYDATVFHIESKMSNALMEMALTIDDLDTEPHDKLKPIFIISGCLAKKSNIAGNIIKVKREKFISAEYNIDAYKNINCDFKTHLILAYENQYLSSNGWKIPPTPRGMSGGAIIKAQGTSLENTKEDEDSTPKQLLSAIITEQHKGKNNSFGFLLGTRVIVHLGLLYSFMPELFTEK